MPLTPDQDAPRSPAERARQYAAEIRAFLLGRLARGRTNESIAGTTRQSLPTPRILSWWIFEGRRYEGLDRCLAERWPWVDRQVRRLMATYNPVWRLVQVPEGETDWVASAFHTATGLTATYVSRASSPGLSNAERDALLGWQRWVTGLWHSYVKDLGPPTDVSPTLPWARPERPEPTVSTAQLVRWAHTARRSRWPLLRNIVAESLRCQLEPSALDALPLPDDIPVLFELLCMVRVLSVLQPHATEVRWLDLDAGRNEVRLPGMTYHFQHNLTDSAVLNTTEFSGGLREAMVRHGVRRHKTIDGWLAFDTPRAGFGGILIEAKSGTQDFSAAVHQLKCYRATLEQVCPHPILVLGIIERDDQTGIDEALHILRQHQANTDLWIFSPASRLTDIVTAIAQ